MASFQIGLNSDVSKYTNKYAFGWDTSTGGVATGHILSDVHTVHIYRELFCMLNETYRTELPKEPVDVLTLELLDEIRKHSDDWLVTKKLDGQRVFLYGRVCKRPVSETYEKNDLNSSSQKVFSSQIQTQIQTQATRKTVYTLQLYSIDSQRVVRFIGKEELPPQAEDVSSFLFETEYLEGKYFVFSALYCWDIPCRTLPLTSQLAMTATTLQRFPFLSSFVFVKQFLNSTDALTCFQETYPELKNDGVVFTRVCTETFDNLPMHIKWKPRHLLTTDFRVVHVGDTYNLYIDDVCIGFLSQTKRVLTAAEKQYIQRYTDSGASCIVESAPESNPESPEKIVWSFERFRPDKLKSNHMSTYQRNLSIFKNFIDIVDIFPTQEENKETQTQEKDKKHKKIEKTKKYWKDDQTLSKRAQHPLRHMRNFHNLIKGEVYRLMFQCIDYLKGDPSVHVELGIGRGGDTNRLQELLPDWVKCVRGIDRDPKALQEAERRWKKAAEQRDSSIRLVTEACDLSSDEEVDRLIFDSNRFRDSKTLSICAHFSAHYFPTNFEFICEKCLLDGGCVAVTMFDKHRVQSLLDQNNGRVVFSVNGKPMVEIKEGRSKDTIDVWIDSIGQSYTEHLLYPEDLLTQEYKILSSFYFDEMKPTRQYTSSSEMWDFTSLYKAVIFQRQSRTRQPTDRPVEYTPQNSKSDLYSPDMPLSPNYRPDSPTSGSDSIYLNGLYSPDVPISPNFRPESP